MGLGCGGQVWGPGRHGAERSKRRDRGWSQDDTEPKLPEITAARGELGVRQEWDPQGAPWHPLGWVLPWPQLYSETARQKRCPEVPHYRHRKTPTFGCERLPRPRGSEGSKPVKTQTPGRVRQAPGVALLPSPFMSHSTVNTLDSCSGRCAGQHVLATVSPQATGRGGVGL